MTEKPYYDQGWKWRDLEAEIARLRNPTDEDVERVAKSLASSSGAGYEWKDFIIDARAALSAYLET